MIDILVVSGLPAPNEEVVERATSALERDGMVHRLDHLLDRLPAELTAFPGTDFEPTDETEALIDAYLLPAQPLLDKADRLLVVNPDTQLLNGYEVSHAIGGTAFAVMRKTAPHLAPNQLQVSHALPALKRQPDSILLRRELDKHVARTGSLRPRPLNGVINGVGLNGIS